MNKMPKAILFAIIAGILGIFLATVGFFRTLLIIIFIVLGFLIGSYWENRKDKDSQE